MAHKTVVVAPAPSLIGPLLPLIKEAEEQMTASVLSLDSIATWDAKQSNHECLLRSVDCIKRQKDDWSAAMLNHLQTAWISETQQYNDYLKKMERTMNIRHCAELDNAFGRLRIQPGAQNQEVSPQHADDMSNRDAASNAEKHLASLGFATDPTSTRLQLLVDRQLKERRVMKVVSQDHHERLMKAKNRDVAKLKSILTKAHETIDALFVAVEKKITAAHHSGSNIGATYRRVPVPRSNQAKVATSDHSQ